MKTTPESRREQYRARGWWHETRITDLFDAALHAVPQRVALVDPPNREALSGGAARRLTYADVAELADAFALRMVDLGIQRDDVLITQLPNIVEYVAVYLAAARLGVIVSPVPMQYRRHELEHIVGITGSRWALTVERFKGIEHACGAVELARDRDLAVLCLGETAPAGARVFVPAALDGAGRARLEAAIAAAAVDADDIFTICWTSGTEGKPKGVPRSHNHWITINRAHHVGANVQPGDILLNPFPLVNMAAIGGCLLSWLRSQGTLLLHHPLDLPVYLQQIATERPHYAIAPPAILNMLIKDEQLLSLAKLDSLRCIGSGSAPLDPGMIQGFHARFGIEVINIFGSNEGISLISGAAEAPDPQKRARLFPRFGRAEIAWPRPAPCPLETRIIDPDTGREILEAERPGEMQIRGPTVFDGYFREPELTRVAFTPDGWFRTGDLFAITGDGGDLRYYRYVGRLKQIIIRGGVKISPEELDEVLSRMPSVLEGAVAGYRDEILGEKICAAVVPRSGQSMTLDDVRKHFAQSGLAIFKRPEKLCLLTALPRNPTGKVMRDEIRRIAEAG
jgi:acyl-CoA synthetase (AMP-forming)/AMP-acid ligase II